MTTINPPRFASPLGVERVHVIPSAGTFTYEMPADTQVDERETKTTALRISVSGGEFVISDDEGAAIGTGGTLLDALTDYIDAGGEMREDLAEEADSLSPAMARRLQLLLHLGL